MGFYSAATLVQDARRHGVKTLPACIVLSDEKCRVDSDDTVADGALAAIAAALSQAKPDVLLLNWESCYPGGRTEPNVHGALLSAVPAGGCTLEEQPQLINLTMTSWSKLFRRDFLSGLDASFEIGRAHV